MEETGRNCFFRMEKTALEETGEPCFQPALNGSFSGGRRLFLNDKTNTSQKVQNLLSVHVVLPYKHVVNMTSALQICTCRGVLTTL